MVCAVPLRARGAVIGALEIGDSRGRVFTTDEVHLAQAFADRAVLSSENARLYAELEARANQLANWLLAQDVAAGDKIPKGLLCFGSRLNRV